MSEDPIAAWDGETAWRNVLAISSARWQAPRRSRHFAQSAAGRLERAVVLPEVTPGFRFDRSARLFTIGSCFARHIENYLLQHGYDVPSGHLRAPGLEEHVDRHATVALNKFTTHSMLNELRWALEPDAAFPEGSLVEEGDGWVDLQLVGEVTPRPREVVLARRACVAEVFRRVRDCHVVVITLGLVEAWFDREQALYLNRAPGYHTVRRHAGRFELRLLDHARNLEALEQIHALLRRHGRDDLRLVVSVSPVPLSETFSGRDVLVANTYSKSTLRAVAEDFARRQAGVDYYPSFESVTLSDRRVAFQDDLHHVADAIVDLNVRRFLDLYAGDAAGDESARLAESARHAEQRLRRLEHDLLAENARLRAEAAELHERLEALRDEREQARLEALASLDADGHVHGPRGERLAAPRVAGAVEVGEARADGQRLVSGWAVDLDAPGRPVGIVAFVDGRRGASTATSIARPDVSQALNVDAPLAGFQLTFDLPASTPSDPTVRVVALDALGRAGELQYHDALYRLRRA